MCGIAGYLSRSRRRSRAPADILRAMGEAIGHRGPDDSDEWWDAEAGVGFAHRRLAIIDLSPAGRQPMQSACGRYTLMYNGEIYNHQDLRALLHQQGRAPAWRGRSDTETLLAAISAWGLEAALKACIGMFAVALWDRSTRTLMLARDRVGEKPLYYGWQGDAFLFGSELKALRAHPAFVGGIDRNTLALYLRHNYLPAPFSIHPGVHKVPPGCIATVSLENPEPAITPYWSALEVARTGCAQGFGGSPRDAVDELDRLLRDAVGRQMAADVPLGAFLSGGIDSSTVVALMQAQSSRAVQTFSIGFHVPGYNEAEHALKVAEHLGAQHAEFYVTPQQALDVIPRLSEIYDEPFADSSQIPTLVVAELARRHVTVSLSGDAGDELFCGYNRYLFTSRFWGAASRFPLALRKRLAQAITSVSPERWNRLGRMAPRVAPNALGDKLHKIAGILDKSSSSELYFTLVSNWTDPEAAVLGSHEPRTPLIEALTELSDLGDIDRMMALDLISYLPDDNLVKIDRATMSTSLEGRVPFLDHRVVEFAWSLPTEYKLNRGVTKWVLRQVLYRYLPPALVERPKMGFGVPIDVWLRTELRDWGEQLLDKRRLKTEGYFDAGQVRQLWEEHLSGRRNWQYKLWGVLMFQAWLERQGQGAG